MGDLRPAVPPRRHSYRQDAAVPRFPDDRPLIVFDGYCGLCSRMVQFVLRHDRRGVFRFVPAQSLLGIALYRHFGLDAVNYDTFILLRDGNAYFASDAAIEIARGLGWPWAIAGAFAGLPRSLRDWVYRSVAENRMRFFGRTQACYLPDAKTRDRFLNLTREDA